jgi:thymidine kinase
VHVAQCLKESLMCARLNEEKKEKVENNRLIMGGSKKWEKKEKIIIE